jgi:hypothetical protein
MGDETESPGFFLHKMLKGFVAMAIFHMAFLSN